MVPKVVILGAGYAGVSAARRLARADTAVTIVNPRPEFVERIRLHQFVVGNHRAVHSLQSVLPESVALRQGSATSIATAEHRVRLVDGTEIDYDYVIYAVGSSGAELITGAGEHAVRLATWEDALAMRSRLNALPIGSTITVVGGGLTAVEAAAELVGASGHRIRIITDGPIAHSVSERGRQRIRDHLTQDGIDVTEHVRVSEIGSDAVTLADGRVLESDLTVDASAVAVPPLARASGLATSPEGALTIADTLVSISDASVIGAGDAVALQYSPLRMSCQAAIPSGVHAAETVLRLVAGTEPERLRRKFVAQCISLGRTSALLQTSDSDDRPRPRAILSGRPAAAVKEVLCRSTLHFGRVGPVDFSWS